MKRPPGFKTSTVLIVAGVAVLLSTLGLGWYATSYGTGRFVANETLYPTAVQLAGNQADGSSYSDAVSFSAIGLDHTGALYGVVTVLVVFAALIGLVSAYLIRRDTTRSRRRQVSVLVVLAVLLAFAGPTLVVVAQPGAMCADSTGVQTPLVVDQPTIGTDSATLACSWDIAFPSSEGGYVYYGDHGPGPQSTLIGSNNDAGEPHSWGPSIGWYIALAASALLVIGAVAYLREHPISPVQAVTTSSVDIESHAEATPTERSD
jgi:hypothetical protein